MATYAIGDIQGCYQSFIKLLNKINFNPKNDQLWLAGDMINRGPASLKVMVYILEHQASIKCVLGNHDLHFLAVAYECKKINPKDTFTDILNSELKGEIVNFLSQQPLAVSDQENKWLMVHAGIHPTWSLKTTLALSKEVMAVIQSADANNFFKEMYGNIPEVWSDDLKGYKRLRTITNIITRMRYLDSNCSLNFTEKDKMENTPNHLIPWFNFPNKKFHSNLVFGHWASLNGNCPQQNHYALDTGCVWGGQLTALRLEDKKLFQCKSTETT